MDGLSGLVLESVPFFCSVHSASTAVLMAFISWLGEGRLKPPVLVTENLIQQLLQVTKILST